jgi:hypothetical protein
VNVTSCIALDADQRECCRCVNSGDVHVCMNVDMCIDVIKMIVFTDSDNARHWRVDRWARQWLTVL